MFQAKKSIEIMETGSKKLSYILYKTTNESINIISYDFHKLLQYSHNHHQTFDSLPDVVVGALMILRMLATGILHLSTLLGQPKDFLGPCGCKNST